MSKLGMVRTAIRSNSSMVRTVRTSGNGFHARRFSTKSEPQQTQDHAVDSFPRTSALDDVKVDYLRNYNPAVMLVHFSSTQAYEQANRTINKKGRLYKLGMVGKNIVTWTHKAR
ncbi:hypothetical protein PanWU01x14_033470 [Parasponia andersonii]|uniref:Uncharacterized protein n=1 Tax=Parasponia andersonii TaxID=3476 RepID=A0A2P5DTP0_PARAD|nr:hypothetical protein PanWU01x14_033470 [Parasponia andersonii]